MTTSSKKKNGLFPKKETLQPFHLFLLNWLCLKKQVFICISLTYYFRKAQMMFGTLNLPSQEVVYLKLASGFFFVVYFYYIFIACSA